MNSISPLEYQVISRLDLNTFNRRVFAELHGNTPLMPTWHLELIAATLTAVRKGTIRRLIINVPPRSLKSVTASIALPAWWLGQEPTARIICASYAQDLADKFARDTRQVVSSPWYLQLFGTRISRHRHAVADFETTAGGYRMGTSVGGVLTGRGADVIIVDDPLKPVEAVSDLLRQQVNDWFDHTLVSRLNDPRTGCIVVIMQRLHEDDLTGHLLAKGGWTHLSLPAIAEIDERHEVDTLFGPKVFRRRQGEPLHGARQPLSILATTKQEIGEYNFAGQYQQSPAPAEGGMIKRAWLVYYDDTELPKAFDAILQSWDTANKVSELSDYSVCTTWGIADRRLFLLDVRRERLDYPELKRAVRAHAERYGANTVLIEDKASGTQLIQELTQDGLYSVRGHTPEGDKIMRMHATSILFENGAVRLPRSAPWLSDYERELTTFPKGKHDDQVDSTSQALAWFQKAREVPGITQYYDMLIRERDRQKEQPAAVRAHSWSNWPYSDPT